MKLCVSIAVLVLGCLAVVSAQNFESAISRIVPSGVRLGLDAEELKANRENLYEGPSAALPGSSQADSMRFATYMEIQGMGKPGHVSYCYLLSENSVVGVIKTTSLIGIHNEAQRTSAQSLYGEFTDLLGFSQQQLILRKGTTAFVPVRSDVWKDPESGSAIYFIATDKEITVAALAQSNFPIEQVFIRPDAERFPIESPAEASIRDLDRPDAGKSQNTQTFLQVQGNQDLSRPSVKSEIIDQPAKQPSASGADVTQTTKKHSVPLVLVFGAVILVSVVFVVFYCRRRT